MTDIRSSSLPGRDSIIEVAGRRIPGISSYYEQGEGLMAIAGSSGYLEISLRDGSASDYLGMLAGDEIKVVLS